MQAEKGAGVIEGLVAHRTLGQLVGCVQGEGKKNKGKDEEGVGEYVVGSQRENSQGMGENEGVILGKVSFWAARETTRASFSVWVGPDAGGETIWARGFPPTKERYCSMVSFGGEDTGKSNIQRER